MHIRTLSAEFGVTENTVRKAVRRLGVEVTRDGTRMDINARGVAALRKHFASPGRLKHMPLIYRDRRSA